MLPGIMLNDFDQAVCNFLRTIVFTCSNHLRNCLNTNQRMDELLIQELVG
jgi:hypothetical protein